VPIIIASALAMRPCAALLARSVAAGAGADAIAASGIRLVIVGAGPSREPSSDGWYAAGLLIRDLLDEIVDDVSVQLSDSAGIAVSLAGDPSGLAGAMLGCARARLRGGLRADDVRVATSINSAPAVGRLDDVPVSEELRVRAASFTELLEAEPR
jgi:phosphosulfolactate phosphohydrolase-like enzyme